MNIRKATPDDARGICEIYNYYIENTVVTFETEPVSEEEMSARISEIIDLDLPYYVGEVEEHIVGFCYIHQWNSKCAYSSTKEITIYLDKNHTGEKLGAMLYDHLFRHIDKERVHVLIAGICIPNEGSVKLHESFGFKQVSHMKDIGKKFNQWLDVGHWQIILDS